MTSNDAHYSTASLSWFILADMLQIGAFQAKNTLGSLLDRVEAGEEIVITRHGRPVARLVPDTRAWDVAAARAALQRMRDHVPAGEGIDWQELKADRDAGRRGSVVVENGRIVQLPEEFRIHASEVSVRREGDDVILSPRPQTWADYLDHGPKASPDFMDNVEDLPVQERQ
jgi:prevent-host-death family protein